MNARTHHAHTGQARYLFEHLDRIRLTRVDFHRLPNDAIAAASDDLYEAKVVGPDLLRFGGCARRRCRSGRIDRGAAPAAGVLGAALHATFRGAAAWDGVKRGRLAGIVSVPGRCLPPAPPRESRRFFSDRGVSWGSAGAATAERRERTKDTHVRA